MTYDAASRMLRYYVFQPFLRFYPTIEPEDYVDKEVTVFQPFLRFYHRNTRKWWAQFDCDVSTLLEILRVETPFYIRGGFRVERFNPS